MGRALFVLVLSMVGGCKDESKSEDSFSIKIAQASCAKTFECCDSQELSTLGQTTEEACRSRLQGLFLLGQMMMSDSVGAGRVELDETAAQCLVDYNLQVSCAEFSADAMEKAPGCAKLWKALVADGGPCTQNYECTTGFCAGAVINGSTTTDGACSAPLAATQACSLGDICTDGYYCDWMSTDVCAAMKIDGTTCSDDEECLSGTCTGTTPVCGPPAPMCP